jgi:hypothetical protein
MVQMPRRHDREELHKQLNTTFQIHFAPDAVMDAELISVSEVREMGSYESFSITFLVPGDCPIWQHTYRIDHPEMGEMALFLVPTGKSDGGATYVSLFNYSKK